MKVLKKYRWLGRSPLTIVELVIAISTIVGGLYVLSPLLDLSVMLNGASPFVQIVGHTTGLYIFGTFFLSSGAIMLIGFVRRDYHWRSVGLFMNIMARLYVLVTTIMINGLLPLTWLSPLTVLVIAIICYLVVRGMIARGLDATT